MRIYPSLTAKDRKDWQSKIEELKKLNIRTFCVFPTRLPKEERLLLYEELDKMRISHIPLVHLRHDMSVDEIALFWKKYDTHYFTIHEDHFRHLGRWKGYFRHLYLEMNFDNYVAKYVDVKRIGGFCIDLSHFKAEEDRWTAEFDYILHERRISREFACNHLNGYNPYKLRDKHTITDLKDFDYLKTLPKFVFGNIIALETENPIREQLAFIRYLKSIL